MLVTQEQAIATFLILLKDIVGEFWLLGSFKNRIKWKIASSP
ncbi:MAG: hypothetical protein WBA93_15470 [Microcoleaceae cyanobacterium]